MMTQASILILIVDIASASVVASGRSALACQAFSLTFFASIARRAQTFTVS